MMSRTTTGVCAADALVSSQVNVSRSAVLSKNEAIMSFIRSSKDMVKVHVKGAGQVSSHQSADLLSSVKLNLFNPLSSPALPGMLI